MNRHRAVVPVVDTDRWIELDDKLCNRPRRALAFPECAVPRAHAVDRGRRRPRRDAQLNPDWRVPLV